LTNSGSVLNQYDIFPVLTLSGVSNTAPYFTTTPSDNDSASTSPTNLGSNVVFTATASSSPGENDDYYLAICQTNSITAGIDTSPTCNGGEWCISDLASSTEEASCTYTAATSSEELAWWAFVCDKYPGFGVGKCSAGSQGTGNMDNNSPFAVNHPPTFTSVITRNDGKDPGSTFVIETTSSDSDSFGGNDRISLYVCLTDAATGGASCDGGGVDEVCIEPDPVGLGSTTPNLMCSFIDTAPTPAGSTTYYAFIFDEHNLGATTNSLSNYWTINNVSPTIGSLILNEDNEIELFLKPSTTTVQLVNSNVDDQNGCADLESATGRIYMSNASGGSNCVADDNDCYHIGVSGCVISGCGGGSDTTAVFTCTADLEYHAIPTDSDDPNNPWKVYNWLGYIYIYDGENYVASTSLGVELGTITGLEVVETDIDFGAGFEVGENTGTDNSTTTIINIGNSPINTDVSGTHMSGNPSGQLDVDNMKWDLTGNFDYAASGTALLLSDKPANIDAPKATTTSYDVKDEIYWGIGIPFGTDASTFTGVNSFIVRPDTNDWPK
jgi:hypothetical protein